MVSQNNNWRKHNAVVEGLYPGRSVLGRRQDGTSRDDYPGLWHGSHSGLLRRDDLRGDRGEELLYRRQVAPEVRSLQDRPDGPNGEWRRGGELVDPHHRQAHRPLGQGPWL